jgi:ubiquinone/menaquinone biosynthesis C-methylase UbiE
VRISDAERSRPERELEPEIMDGPLSYGEARRALRDLDRVNRLTFGLGGLLRCLLPRLENDLPLTLLDVGTGTGFGTHRLARAARRRGASVRIIGIDRRLAHLVIGRDRGIPQLRVAASADALPFKNGAFDWTSSHLLFHHFDGRSNRKIIEEMLRCARRGVAVVDLRRSPWAALLARVLFPLLRIGHVATEDGVLSIRQSWTPAEVHHLARRARWPLTELRKRFPFRWSLVLTHRKDP